MPIDTTNTDVELSGAGEEYEYKSGSYLDMLQLQLNAIKNQQELEEEKDEEDAYNAPLGERNMGYLNTYLTLRQTVETLRDTSLLNQAGDMGGITKEDEPGGWRQKKHSKLGKIGRTLIGWAPGLEAIPEEEKKVTTGTTKGEYKESKFHVQNVKDKLTNEATDTSSETEFSDVRNKKAPGSVGGPPIPARNQADTKENRKKIANMKKTGNPNKGSYGSGSSSPVDPNLNKKAVNDLKQLKKDGKINEAATRMMNNVKYVKTSYGWKQAGL